MVYYGLFLSWESITSVKNPCALSAGDDRSKYFLDQSKINRDRSKVNRDYKQSKVYQHRRKVYCDRFNQGKIYRHRRGQMNVNHDRSD